MSRHCSALFQTWRIVNLCRPVILSSSNTLNHNFYRKCVSVSLRKHEGNMRLLAKSSPIMYSTSTSPKSDEMPSGQMPVTRYNIVTLISKLKSENDKAEKGLQLLMICKDAGRLNVKIKRELVTEIWNILAENRAATDKHCEEYLLCNLKCRSVVNPQLFLSDLIKCKTFINCRILKLLLECSCNHGLLSDINFILLTMDEMQFPISKEVQRILMLGKAKAGEMDEVFKIFKELELLEGVASHETYAALLNAIACTGDQKLLNDYYKEALEYEINFTEDDVLSILETSIYNNHLDLISDILEWKSKFDEGNLKKFLLNLTSHNHCEVAVLLLPTISEMKEDEVFVQSFIKRIIQANIPFDDVLSVCKLFIEKKASESVLLSATHFYLLKKNIDESLKMFQILLDNELSVRIHYFWPLIITSAREDGAEGVFRILKEMRKYKMEFDQTTVINYIMPKLGNLEPLIIVRKICDETGWLFSEIFDSAVHFFLNVSKLSDVYTLLEGHKDRIQRVIKLSPFAKHLSRKVSSTNIQLSAEIVALLPPSFATEFLIQLSRSITDIQLFVSIIKVLHKKNLGISRGDYHFMIESILKRRVDVTSGELDEVAPNLLTLVINNAEENRSDFGNKPDVIYLQEKIGTNRTKEYFEKLLSQKESKNENPSFVLCNLLSIYIQSKNYEKAMEIKNKAKELSIKLTPGLKSKLLQLSIEKKDLQSSVLYYKEILAEHPTFEIDTYKIVLLTSLLVEKGLSDQAFEVLEATAKTKRSPPQLHNRVMELLENVAKHENIDLYQKFVESLVRKNMSVVDAKLFYPQMKWYLEKGKTKKACELFSYCAKNYKIAPAPSQLICCVLEECEIDVLRKILQIYETTCSKMEVRTVTSFAYAETGRQVELKNYLLENPVKPFIDNTYSKKMIDFAVRNGKSVALETLFFSLYPSQEAEELIPHIFKSYTFNEDKDRPLKFLEKITKDNVQFPIKYGEYLASVINFKKEIE